MSDARNLTMSTKELDRLEIIGRVVERRLTQRDAAERLGLSLRQAERLCRAFRTDGASGLVSHKRGRRSNRKLSSALRERALDLVRERYADFGPTLACEKLAERHPYGTNTRSKLIPDDSTPTITNSIAVDRSSTSLRSPDGDGPPALAVARGRHGRLDQPAPAGCR